jgi:hypothetical protein
MEIRYQQPNLGASDEDGAPSDETRRPWARQPIGEVGVDITRGPDGTLHVRPAGALHPDAETVHHVARLLPHAAGDVGGAVLVLPSRGTAILVNGSPPLAVTELPDGAELSIGADSLFYQSSERAEIESFAAVGIEVVGGSRRSLDRFDRAFARFGDEAPDSVATPQGVG